MKEKNIENKLIRSGLYAWTLICREMAKNTDMGEEVVDEKMNMQAPVSCTHLPLDEKLLNRCLMLLNLTMSEALIRKWIKQVRPQLECENPERKKFERLLTELRSEQTENELHENKLVPADKRLNAV